MARGLTSKLQWAATHHTSTTPLHRTTRLHHGKSSEPASLLFSEQFDSVNSDGKHANNVILGCGGEGNGLGSEMEAEVSSIADSSGSE